MKCEPKYNIQQVEIGYKNKTFNSVEHNNVLMINVNLK